MLHTILAIVYALIGLGSGLAAYDQLYHTSTLQVIGHVIGAILVGIVWLPLLLIKMGVKLSNW